MVSNADILLQSHMIIPPTIHHVVETLGSMALLVQPYHCPSILPIFLMVINMKVKQITWSSREVTTR
jgi:hypothetical protein